MDKLSDDGDKYYCHHCNTDRQIYLRSIQQIMAKIADERLKQIEQWHDYPTHVYLNHLVVCMNKHLGLAVFALLGQDYTEAQRRIIQVAAICISFCEMAAERQRIGKANKWNDAIRS